MSGSRRVLSEQDLQYCAEASGRVSHALSSLVSLLSESFYVDAHEAFRGVVFWLHVLGEGPYGLDLLANNICNLDVVDEFEWISEHVSSLAFRRALDVATEDPSLSYRVCGIDFDCAYQAVFTIARNCIVLISERCEGNPAWSFHKLRPTDDELIRYLSRSGGPWAKKAVDELGPFDATALHSQVLRDIDFMRIQRARKRNVDDPPESANEGNDNYMGLRVDGMDLHRTVDEEAKTVRVTTPSVFKLIYYLWKKGEEGDSRTSIVKCAWKPTVVDDNMFDQQKRKANNLLGALNLEIANKKRGYWHIIQT